MESNQKKPACFLAFEGIDGSGKSTQVRLLKQRLKTEQIPCYVTKEPTDSPIGALIRSFMTGDFVSDNRVVAALFVADRLDHLLNPDYGIKAKLDSGIPVITDRYYFSSYAYHSVDMPMEWVIGANSESAKLLKPTVTVFVDVDPEDAVNRITQNRSTRELFENLERLTAVRAKYLEAFERLKDQETVLIMDGSQPEEVLAARIWEKTKDYFLCK